MENIDKCVLPHSLRSIRFGNNFNQRLTYFPNELRTLVLGNEYNQIIEKFPNKLEYLQIGDQLRGSEYNRNLPELPKTIKTIYLHSDTMKLKNIIPSDNLNYLIIKEKYKEYAPYCKQSSRFHGYIDYNIMTNN